MILAETRYETHDGELLAIVKAFKTWRYYLEGYKHEVLVLTDHNNLCRFMDTKSLSSRQVRWAQELSQYHFRIDYCQAYFNRRSCWCSVVLLSCPSKCSCKCLALSVSEKNLWGFHVSKPCFHIASKPYSFKPYPVGSLHFFNSDPILPDPCLRNIRPVLATSVVRRVLKQASWRTYKANIGGIRLRLQGL